jgi:hypothetical protein
MSSDFAQTKQVVTGVRRGIALAIFVLGVSVIPGLTLASELRSWKWFFAPPVAVVMLLCLIAAFGRSEKRNLTPQGLADELERHLVGNEGQYDWGGTTSEELVDERLNRLIPRLIQYDRLDTAEKREQFREIIEALRRGEIPD